VINVTLPWPVHFCPAYPCLILLSPPGLRKVKLELDSFYTIDSPAAVIRILNTDELERRLANGAVLFNAKQLSDMQPIIDRAEQFDQLGFDVRQIFPPDGAKPCDWCPAKAAKTRRRRGAVQ
jgi:hypothetical protein